MKKSKKWEVVALILSIIFLCIVTIEISNGGALQIAVNNGTPFSIPYGVLFITAVLLIPLILGVIAHCITIRASEERSGCSNRPECSKEIYPICLYCREDITDGQKILWLNILNLKRMTEQIGPFHMTCFCKVVDWEQRFLANFIK
jgi:hypothetical protein